MKLTQDFYTREDVVQIAQELLGKSLHTFIDRQYTAAKITEVEAYCGRNDKACHAHGKKTPRTQVMYEKGGFAYVYLCYGIHHLFNIVTNQEGQADAVLIRAVEPVEGLDIMMKRRKASSVKKTLCSGPGTMTQAMGISTQRHYGLDLRGSEIWIEDAPNLAPDEMVTSTRIGVEYAEEDALKPWRFYKKDNLWISKK